MILLFEGGITAEAAAKLINMPKVFEKFIFVINHYHLVFKCFF